MKVLTYILIILLCFGLVGGQTKKKTSNPSNILNDRTVEEQKEIISKAEWWEYGFDKKTGDKYYYDIAHVYKYRTSVTSEIKIEHNGLLLYANFLGDCLDELMILSDVFGQSTEGGEIFSLKERANTEAITAKDSWLFLLRGLCEVGEELDVNPPEYKKP